MLLFWQNSDDRPLPKKSLVAVGSAIGCKGTEFLTPRTSDDAGCAAHCTREGFATCYREARTTLAGKTEIGRGMLGAAGKIVKIHVWGAPLLRGSGYVAYCTSACYERYVGEWSRGHTWAVWRKSFHRP